MNRIINNPCEKALKELEDNSVDLIVTDPPYGYSFMGKDWDKAVPSVEVWKECLRVLKPGAFAFVMSAPRQDVLSQMIVRIGEAGFDTDFTSIYWTYASGFPKAMNIGKMVDKRAGLHKPVLVPTKPGNLVEQTGDVALGATGFTDISERVSDQAKALDGSYGGFQPKPAVEVIIVAMKPLSEKTYVDQALKNGKGITWLDDCRVPTKPRTTHKDGNYRGAVPEESEWSDEKKGFESGYQGIGADGRFPANLLVSDDVLNDGRVQKSGKAIKHRSAGMNFGGGTKPTTDDLGYGDTGSYSRYFDLDAWAKTLPFLIVPKASKSEKNGGLGDGSGSWRCTCGQIQKGHDSSNCPKKQGNHHPTVKPLKLMSYLITLGSREGDVVLDPFLGSGTTACAAKALGRKYIGIEMSREYAEIARARVLHTEAPQSRLLPAE